VPLPWTSNGPSAARTAAASSASELGLKEAVLF
jgi:hypothetical protein